MLENLLTEKSLQNNKNSKTNIHMFGKKPEQFYGQKYLKDKILSKSKIC